MFRDARALTIDLLEFDLTPDQLAGKYRTSLKTIHTVAEEAGLDINQRDQIMWRIGKLKELEAEIDADKAVYWRELILPEMQ